MWGGAGAGDGALGGSGAEDDISPPCPGKLFLKAAIRVNFVECLSSPTKKKFFENSLDFVTL